MSIKQIKNNIFFASFIFLFFFFIFPIPSSAQEAGNSADDQVKEEEDRRKKNTDEKERVNSGEIRVVATINAGNINIDDKGENNFEVSFDVINNGIIQPGVKFAVNLVQKKNEEEKIVDRKMYDEVLSIGNGEIIHKTLSYQAPDYLNGEYFLFIEAQNNSDLRLVYLQVGKINLSNKESIIEVEDDYCGVFLGEKKLENKDISNLPENQIQKASLKCLVGNISQEKIDIFLKADFYEKSYFKNASETRKSEEISLASEEKRELEISLTELKDIKSPLVAVSIFSKNGRQIAESMYLSLYNMSKAPLFYNVRLDKDYYLKGETAKMTVDMRLAYSEGSYISYGIFEEKGASCIKNKEMNADIKSTGSTEIQEKIVRNCFNPEMTVFVKDKSGNILDEEKYSVESKSQEAKDAKERASMSPNKLKIIQLSIIISLILIVLIKATHAIYKCRKYKMPMIIFFLAIGFLFLSDGAKADTVVAGSVTVTVNSPIPPHEGNTALYVPDDDITYSATATGFGSVGIRLVLDGYCYWLLDSTYELEDYDDLDPNRNIMSTFVSGTATASKTYKAHTKYRVDESGRIMNGIQDGCSEMWWRINIDGSNYYLDAIKPNTYIKVRGVCGDGVGFDGSKFKFWRASCTYGEFSGETCSGDGYARWQCLSADPIPDTDCKYPKDPAPKCSSNSGTVIPTANLAAPSSWYCDFGGPYYTSTIFGTSQNSVYFNSTTGTLNWSCQTGLWFCDANCSAVMVCKSDTNNKKYYTSSPLITDLCFRGASNSFVWNSTFQKWTWNCNYGGTNYACEAGLIGTTAFSINGKASETISAGANPTFSWSSSNSECRACNSNSIPPAVLGWRTNLNYISNYSSCMGSSNTNYYGTKPTSGSVQYQHNNPGNITYGLICRNPGTGIYANQNYTSYASATLTVSDPVTCGSANGVSTCNAPISGLCSDSSNPVVNYSAPNYAWICGGNLCQALKDCPVAPSCGTAVNEEDCSVPSSNLCINNTNTPVVDSSSPAVFKWTCSSPGGSIDCLAVRHCAKDDVWKEINL